MPPIATLDIALQTISKEEELTKLVHTLHNTLLKLEAAIYALLLDKFKLIEVFLA